MILFTPSKSLFTGCLIFGAGLLQAKAVDDSRTGNLAVYYGQNSYNAANDGNGTQQPLSIFCQDDTIDVIPLAFLSNFFSTGDLPEFGMSSTCSSSGNPFSGTSLANCHSLADDIKACQAKGKILTLSIGGAASNTSFSSNSQAEDFADTIWNLFLGGESSTRPFDTAVLDGIDLDIEIGSSAVGYAAFVDRIRSRAMGTNKKYYVTAAPQCDFPDAHLSDVLNAVAFDAVYVQAWNFDVWDNWAKTEAINKKVKIYIGAPASPSAAGSGYVDATTLGRIAQETRFKYSSFGGVMLWDASQAYGNFLFSTSQFSDCLITLTENGHFDKQIKNALSDDYGVDFSSSTTSSKQALSTFAETTSTASTKSLASTESDATFTSTKQALTTSTETAAPIPTQKESSATASKKATATSIQDPKSIESVVTASTEQAMNTSAEQLTTIFTQTVNMSTNEMGATSTQDAASTPIVGKVAATTTENTTLAKQMTTLFTQKPSTTSIEHATSNEPALTENTNYIHSEQTASTSTGKTATIVTQKANITSSNEMTATSPQKAAFKSITGRVTATPAEKITTTTDQLASISTQKSTTLLTEQPSTMPTELATSIEKSTSIKNASRVHSEQATTTSTEKAAMIVTQKESTHPNKTAAMFTQEAATTFTATHTTSSSPAKATTADEKPPTIFNHKTSTTFTALATTSSAQRTSMISNQNTITPPTDNLTASFSKATTTPTDKNMIFTSTQQVASTSTEKILVTSTKSVKTTESTPVITTENTVSTFTNRITPTPIEKVTSVSTKETIISTEKPNPTPANKATPTTKKTSLISTEKIVSPFSVKVMPTTTKQVTSKKTALKSGSCDGVDAWKATATVSVPLLIIRADMLSLH
ncbi:hypothetical protein H0H87_004410 [Tephrocybe sp. NHM501043]|nr:hypothetical protein H0H87_004410 [Tephrocybe sp. NHM501043]